MKFLEAARTLDCIHCGLCIPHCPTHAVTGREADSPRGRIYLMRGTSEDAFTISPEAQAHLDGCIVCRGCESVCPSGIRMGDMMESFRAATRRTTPPRGLAAAAQRFLYREILPHRNRIAALTDLLELHQRTRAKGAVDWLLGAISPRLARLHGFQPRVPKRGERRLPTDRQVASHAPTGPRRARVGLFLGCIASEWFAPVHRATIRVLVGQGVEVVVPDAQTCCGALHRHAGMEEDAAALFARNVDAFKKAGVDAIVVNAAGCGAALKEPPHGAADFGPPVKDIGEFLRDLGLVGTPRALPLRVTIDQPCHLVHGQRLGPEIVEGLLAGIPELTLVPLPGSERCCGAGGVYNLLQPEMADAILEAKINAIRGTGAEVVATANPGCAMQIAHGLTKGGFAAIDVVHPIELLDRAYV